jgi:hypothetical protein
MFHGCALQRGNGGSRGELKKIPAIHGRLVSSWLKKEND